jgi:integrase/recombinase XerD
MKRAGLAHARAMRYWPRKGGSCATPDGFDRSSPFTLARLIDGWMEHRAERNYSPRTLESDKWAARGFLQWAHERDLRLAGEITKPILESYQRYVYHYRTAKDRPLSITAQRKRMAVLQRFFAWLCRRNFILANPASELELPRKETRLLPKALGHEEIARLLALPKIDDPLGVRDRAILEVFYATGVRRSELVRLDLEDIDHERAVLRVRQGKGNKDRMVPLGERAHFWINRYLEECRPQLEVNGGERALFLTGFGERFNIHYIGTWVRRLLDQAGVAKGGSCHLLRHSCATHMLENGADIRLIGQLLGHSRLDTTQIYTEVDIRHLREVHARTHPSAKLI